MSVKPITPSDIPNAKKNIIPDAVFEVVNELIAKNYSGRSARVTQADIVNKLAGRGISNSQIYAEKYLDIEEIYEQNGWDVEYDKPGYNESYGAYFVFTAKKTR